MSTYNSEVIFFLIQSSDQHFGHHHDGEKASQQNVPPSHDQSLLLGPGKLPSF